MFDELIECKRCKSDAAYSREIDDKITITQCLGCGFWTNSLMKKGEQFFDEQMETLPNLYKELIGEDKDGNIWVPSYIDVDEGMIFANGKSAKEWKWAVVQKIDIPEDEREKYPIPNKKGEFYKRRTDMETLVEFDEKDFMEGMDLLNLL